MAQAIRRGLCTVGATGLGEDVTHVRGHGVEADEQRVGDVSIALAGGEKAQHFQLALRQLVGDG